MGGRKKKMCSFCTLSKVNENCKFFGVCSRIEGFEALKNGTREKYNFVLQIQSVQTNKLKAKSSQYFQIPLSNFSIYSQYHVYRVFPFDLY